MQIKLYVTYNNQWLPFLSQLAGEGVSIIRWEQLNHWNITTCFGLLSSVATSRSLALHWNPITIQAAPFCCTDGLGVRYDASANRLTCLRYKWSAAPLARTVPRSAKSSSSSDLYLLDRPIYIFPDISPYHNKKTKEKHMHNSHNTYWYKQHIQTASKLFQYHAEPTVRTQCTTSKQYQPSIKYQPDNAQPTSIQCPPSIHTQCTHKQYMLNIDLNRKKLAYFNQSLQSSLRYFLQKEHLRPLDFFHP